MTRRSAATRPGGNGGGIYINAKGAVIDLNNGSTIDGNETEDGGGGIYCNVSFFTIKSSDGTGAIYGNKAYGSNRATTKGGQSGGGIHVDAKSGENEGLIEGLTISNNYSAYDGGGLELDQRWTTVRNCSITGNTCKYEGGGAYVCNNNVLLDNCTVTGNACNLAGKNYEGGGVFVWCDYDLKLAGTCVISDNTRGKDTGNADDVLLRDNAGSTAKAYVTGYLAKGSRVGVRTASTGDRRIAKSFKSETNDALFIDLSGYYVSYGGEEGGDAWQRHRELAFAAKVNGEVKARYKQGAQALLAAAATKGDDQVFWHWDAEGTTGLYPVKNYITNDNCLAAALAFDMPQHDVDAAAVYATRAKKALVAVEAPVAGKALPSVAEVRRADAGVGGNLVYEAPVTWYEVGEGGERTAAAGAAKGGTAYVASITCAEAPEHGLYFGKSLAAADVTVRTASGEAPAAYAKVDAATGAPTVETAAFAKTAGTAPAKSTTVKVNAKKKSVKEAVAETGDAQAAAAAALASLGDEAAPADDGSLGGLEVSCAEGSGDVTIAAPAEAGYNFCNWEGVPEAWERDDEAGTLTIPESTLANGGDIDVTAVYTPVVTEVEVEMDEPAPAAGERLAASAGKIVLTASDGEEIDLVEAVGKQQCAVTWSPDAEGGIAGYSTAYTALVEVADADGLSGVEKVLATDASVKVCAAGGASALGAEAAAFTVIDGKLYLAISFPATRDAKATSVTAPVVELTFEEARTCAESGEWPLPSAVAIEVEGGQAAEGDVEWASVEGFDADAAGAQELTVKGMVTRVTTADDVPVDTSGLSLDVTATVKVAAPEDSASGDDKKDEGGTKDEGEKKEGDTEKKGGATDTGEAAAKGAKKAAKKGIPSTGDAAHGGPAGLLALAVACIAAARISRREG